MTLGDYVCVNCKDCQVKKLGMEVNKVPNFEIIFGGEYWAEIAVTDILSSLLPGWSEWVVKYTTQHGSTSVALAVTSVGTEATLKVDLVDR